jgi:hypothetical protein
MSMQRTVERFSRSLTPLIRASAHPRTREANGTTQALDRMP